MCGPPPSVDGDQTQCRGRVDHDVGVILLNRRDPVFQPEVTIDLTQQFALSSLASENAGRNQGEVFWPWFPDRVPSERREDRRERRRANA